jgi:hypothetical protein
MANEKRLIDAYTLAEEIESLNITVAGKPARWNDAKHSVLCIIAEQPDVDAVEVVRCKDCRRWDEGTGFCDEHSHLYNLGLEWDMFDKDDFCSYGVRKDND